MREQYLIAVTRTVLLDDTDMDEKAFICVPFGQNKCMFFYPNLSPIPYNKLTIQYLKQIIAQVTKKFVVLWVKYKKITNTYFSLHVLQLAGFTTVQL
jgi:hypothetical protein